MKIRINFKKIKSFCNDQKYQSGIVLSAAAAFMLCVFEPLCIYFQNITDYVFDIYTMLPLCGIMWIIAMISCVTFYTLICSLLPRLCTYVLYLAFSCYLCLYVQGNFFVKDLAQLDGSEIDWSTYSSQYTQSIILWLTIFIMTAALFFLFKKDRFYGIVRITATIMLLIFIVTTFTTGLLNNGFHKKPDITVTYKNLLEYSPQENFIILVMDTVDTEYENRTLEKYPEDRDLLKDFTYYDNVVSGYGYTENALPFLVGGKWFEYQENFEEYLEWTYLESPLIKELRARDYIMDLYSDDAPTTTSDILEYDNIIDNVRHLEHPVDFAKVWLRLVGYKYLPYPLKPYSQVLPSEFAEHFSDSIGDYRIWNFYYSNWPFYAFHRDEPISVSEDGKPRFKLIHIAGAHSPFELNRNMEYSQITSYTDCVEASNTMIRTYLDKLKEYDVYDNSVIMILADHGIGYDEMKEDIGRQDPILFVKGKYESHDIMQINSAPISQEDYVDSYLKLLNGYRSDAIFNFKEGDKRERRCLLPGETGFIEYIQYGQASDNDSFLPSGRIILP